MPKPAVRTLIQLRRQLDRIEADLAEDRRETGLASTLAIAQLNMGQGEERIVKFAGENWKVLRKIDGVDVHAQVVDENI